MKKTLFLLLIILLSLVSFGQSKKNQNEQLAIQYYQSGEYEKAAELFEDIFDKYNGEENFFFLDPPYDSVFTDYGYCKYDRENHLQLHEKFINTKSKCLMVIGETEFITELYKDYIKDKFHKKYSFKIHSGRVGNEIDNYHLIITNY